MKLAILSLLLACSPDASAPERPATPSATNAPAPPSVPLMPSATAAPAATVAIGQPAPDFSMPALDGSTVKLADHKGKVVVLEWFNPGCPFVKYAHGEGPLRDLAAQTTQKGVVWLAINSSGPGKEGHGLAANQEAAKTWSMGHPVLLDESGEVGKKYGARTTPHMYVVDPAGNLAYMGALDNAPLGKTDGPTLTSYVTTAVDALLASSPVPTSSTKPYGCSVKYGS